MIPSTHFLNHTVSRLVIGGNPFSGHSYISSEMNEEMLNYHTSRAVVDTLLYAEKVGYNTCQLLADDFMLRVLREYRNCGGSMQWIAQTHPTTLLKANLVAIMKQKPIAIFHQGTVTDNLVEEGRITELRANIKMIQDTGLPTGMATHVPETLLRAEEENWGLDFYMACVHNLRRNGRYESAFITGKYKQLTFFQDDRAVMLNVISHCAKPCIAYKILAGGHLCATPQSIESAFRETYQAIKHNDIAVVGVFQKYKDQVRENAQLATKVLAEL